jgi:DNA repair exonuclease SbcCD ATPase subunit
MRRTIVRLIGLATVAVGAIGLIVSLVVIDKIWKGTRHLRRDVPEVLEQLEEIVHSVHQQGDATVGLLVAARRQTSSISDILEEVAKHSDQGITVASILKSLEQDIGHRLEDAEAFVTSMQASLRSMSSALLVLDSVPLFSQQLAPARSPQERRLVAVASGLTEAAHLLDQLIGIISRLRSDQTISPRQVAQARQTLRLVDRQLAEIQKEIQAFSERLKHTASQLTTLRRRIIPWTDRAATIATVLLVCFGCSQVSLLVHGWRLLCR